MKLKFALFPALAFAAACSTADTATQNAAVNNMANQNANAQVAIVSPTETPNLQPEEVPVYDTTAAALDGGKKFFEADEDEKAVQAFEQAVKLDANNAEAHFELAIAYATLDRTEESEKSFNNAIKIYQKQTAKNPKDAVAFFNLGRAYNKINEDQKAQKALQQAIKLNPDDSEMRLELGKVFIKLAQYNLAVKELEKAFELDPENSRAEIALEQATAGDKRIKDAQAQNKAKAAQNKPVAQTSAKPGGNSRPTVPNDAVITTPPIAPAPAKSPN